MCSCSKEVVEEITESIQQYMQAILDELICLQLQIESVIQANSQK